MPSAVGNVILAGIPLSSQLLSTTAVQALQTVLVTAEEFHSAPDVEEKRKNETEMDRFTRLLQKAFESSKSSDISGHNITPRQRSTMKRVYLQKKERFY